MTLPSEQVSTLKRVRKWLRELATSKRKSQSEIKRMCCSLLSHYPSDYHIEKKWSEVCHDCGQNKEFCRCDGIEYKEGSCGHQLKYKDNFGRGYDCKLLVFKNGEELNSEELLCGECLDRAEMSGYLVK